MLEKMLRSTLFKRIFILACLIAVIKGEHLFESLLQRRAKPIHWKWSNDLSNMMKPSDAQRRRRFLPEPSKMEKWWRTMSFGKDVKLDAVTNKEPPTRVEETYYRRHHFNSPRINRLPDTSAREKENIVVINSTQTFREEMNFRQDGQLPFDKLDTLTLPVEPFDRDNHVLLAARYLTPTEKSTYFSEPNFPDAFGNTQSISQQREVENEDYGSSKTESDGGPFLQQHDADSEFLRELVIHERHKPSKFEHQTVSQRIKEFRGTEKDFSQTNDKSMSSVEYIVPFVENVESQVEYADNISDSEAAVTPSADFLTPTVEFVEPEVEYIAPKVNSSNEPKFFVEYVDPPITEEIYQTIEELPNENKYPLEKNENESMGTEFRILGLRREQVRVRRNYGKKLEIGVSSEDYPTLEALPVVQFYCGDYMPGYYVDITTKCQVFHICHENGQRSSFLCPVGTVFNQEYLVCDWWYNVDCDSSSKYYNSESLQAYSANNERQKTLYPSGSEKRDPVVVKSERKVPAPIAPKLRSYSDVVKEKNRFGSSNSRSNLANLSHKAVNYPVGYAILLREYMKNSIVSDNQSEGRDYQHAYPQNNKETVDVDDDKFRSDEGRAAEKYVENLDNSPITTSYYNVSRYSPSNPRYLQETKPYIIFSSVSSQPKNKEYKHVSENIKRVKPYLRKPYGTFEFRNHNRSRNDFGGTSQVKALPIEEENNLNNPSRLVKDEIRYAYKKHKPIEDKEYNKARPVFPSNSKRNQKASSEANRYHFIINPSEAIRPASGKHYSILEKNNSSTIKFRHAESTIKHIKPQTNNGPYNLKGKNTALQEPFIENGSQGKYQSSISYPRDKEALHSVPLVSQAAKPSQSSRRKYGERLSIKSRSIPPDYERFILFNETRNEYILGDPETNYPSTYHDQNDLRYDSINQLKNNPNDFNSSYESILLESESSFNFEKFNGASDLVLKNKKQKSKNVAQLFYIRSDKQVKRDTAEVSVDFGTKDNGLAPKYIKTISFNNDTSLASEHNGTTHKHKHHNKSSELKSQQKDFNKNVVNQNNSFPLNQDINLKNSLEDFNETVTKINNSLGGFIIIRVSKIIPNITLGLINTERKQIEMNITQNKIQLNKSMPHI